jgi:hypothetical protein
MEGKQTVVPADLPHVPSQETVLDVSQEDRDWLDELRMVSDLIIALARARGELTEQDVDRALGLERPEQRADAPG